MVSPAPPVLDLPFIPDAGYLRFVAAQGARVHSMHVPMHLPEVADARPPGQEVDTDHLVELLGLVPSSPGPRKHALLNGRFHAPEAYVDKSFLQGLAARLQILLEAGQLHGIIYDDHYLLRALADFAPDLCAELEAIPSVNCRLDSLPRVLWHVRYARAAGFRPPGQIVPDRELNRRLPELEALVAAVRGKFPDLQIILLANEGCLPQCPFKTAHGGHMALGHIRGLSPAHIGANRNIGCSRLFAERPELLFGAPFIRPEDQGAYAHVANAFKVCGRTRGAQVMERIARSYLEERYAGNLLWLLDTQECLAPALYVANEELPDDFLSRLSRCDGDCEDCGQCCLLAARHVRRQSPGDSLGAGALP